MQNVNPRAPAENDIFVQCTCLLDIRVISKSRRFPRKIELVNCCCEKKHEALRSSGVRFLNLVRTGSDNWHQNLKRWDHIVCETHNNSVTQKLQQFQVR